METESCAKVIDLCLLASYFEFSFLQRFTDCNRMKGRPDLVIQTGEEHRSIDLHDRVLGSIELFELENLQLVVKIAF